MDHSCPGEALKLCQLSSASFSFRAASCWTPFTSCLMEVELEVKVRFWPCLTEFCNVTVHSRYELYKLCVWLDSCQHLFASHCAVLRFFLLCLSGTWFCRGRLFEMAPAGLHWLPAILSWLRVLLQGKIPLSSCPVLVFCLLKANTYPPGECFREGCLWIGGKKDLEKQYQLKSGPNWKENQWNYVGWCITFVMQVESEDVFLTLKLL